MIKRCMLVERLGRQRPLLKSSQSKGCPTIRPTMMRHKLRAIFPIWNDLTSSLRYHEMRWMSVNTKGSASGWRDKPSYDPDCPESDMGGWIPKRPKTIEGQDPKKIEMEEPKRVANLSSEVKLLKSLSPTTDSSKMPKHDSLRKQKATIDTQRAIYQEKQSNYRVDFTKVTSAPGPSKEEWWYPDPYAGFYVPKGQFGKISRGKAAVIAKSKNKVESVGEKGWWVSMEDLPNSLS